MGETTFKFAEFDSKTDLNLYIKDVQRSITGDLSAQVNTIPGRRGELYEGTKFGAKQIIVEAIIKANNEKERVLRARELGQLVDSTGDNSLYPLIFSDEPDITYWCYVNNYSTPSRVLERGADTDITITFNAPEGVGYGERVSQIITEPTVKITPTGTAPTYPVLTLQVGEPITKAGVATEEDFVYVGSEVEEGTNTATSKMVLNDPCNTMATWTQLTTPSFNIENGIVGEGATMYSTGDAIQVTKKDGRFYYGDSKDKTKWQGPVYQQGLPSLLRDWKITARIYTDNRYARSRSKIELYFLNSVGARIGRIMVKDNGIDLQNELLVEIGPNDVNQDVFLASRDAHKITKSAKTTTKTISITDKRKTTDKKAGYKKGDTYSRKLSVQSNDTENQFTDFYGSITLEKKGNKYTVEIQPMEKGGVAKGSKFAKTFTDSNNKYTEMMENFAGVALYSATLPITEDSGTTAPTYKQNVVQLTDLRVWNLGQSGADPSDIFEVGDEVIFDLDNGYVYKNGEKANFAIGSNFFSIPPRLETEIGLLPPPSEKNIWTLDMFSRWL